MTLRDISTVRAGYPIRGEITPARDGEVAIVTLNRVERRNASPGKASMRQISVLITASSGLEDEGSVWVISEPVFGFQTACR